MNILLNQGIVQRLVRQKGEMMNVLLNQGNVQRFVQQKGVNDERFVEPRRF